MHNNVFNHDLVTCPVIENDDEINHADDAMDLNDFSSNDNDKYNNYSPFDDIGDDEFIKMDVTNVSLTKNNSNMDGNNKKG